MTKVITFLAACLLFSCSETSSLERVQAYVPIYKTYEEIEKITLQPDKKLEQTGKIYLTDNALLISEPGKGVHFFNNENPTSPKRVAFLSIPGNDDIELRNGFLYVDNGLDLVTIDISVLSQPVVTHRERGVFPYPMYPPMENIKFTCPDPSKGFVVDWVLESVVDPKCSR